ncbi:siderophore ABC transporter substrate-binding protein (plasmid) [Aliirhizobium terrae]|uniref:siderophore ABC transporter substrate-binding protein n=1 Tax=Terrirhizobium terrae TaxID=2926709 RepID=UPI0025786185|nr:siderophore ABC transporter substrate-binding protein [Rhizobium sp. CC-CFT758]WJH37884.1 siderophore ABC transporter substrate-binding protein [Rhizobium sp. CC-CFT758]
MLLRSVAFLVLLLASASPVLALDIRTARGTIDVPAEPAKVAVFDIAALDTLDRLGIKPAGVPEKLYLQQLDHLKSGAEVVGDIFEPDLEALSALEPDLIILGGRSSTKVDSAAQVAPTIDMTMDGDDLVEQAKQRLADYGALFGKQAGARKIAAELDGEIDAARAAAKGKGKALIIMTNGPKITAYGPGSRFGWVHAALDLPPAVADVQAATHGEAISFEFIHKANPDWLLVVDRASAIGSGEQSARATLDNELVAGTTAWRQGQVVYLPAADFYIAAGGIQATQRVMTTLREAFAAAR